MYQFVNCCFVAVRMGAGSLSFLYLTLHIYWIDICLLYHIYSFIPCLSIFFYFLFQQNAFNFLFNCCFNNRELHSLIWFWIWIRRVFEWYCLINGLKFVCCGDFSAFMKCFDMSSLMNIFNSLDIDFRL